MNNVIRFVPVLALALLSTGCAAGLYVQTPVVYAEPAPPPPVVYYEPAPPPVVVYTPPPRIIVRPAPVIVYPQPYPMPRPAYPPCHRHRRHHHCR